MRRYEICDSLLIVIIEFIEEIPGCKGNRDAHIGVRRYYSFSFCTGECFELVYKLIATLRAIVVDSDAAVLEIVDENLVRKWL